MIIVYIIMGGSSQKCIGGYKTKARARKMFDHVPFHAHLIEIDIIVNVHKVYLQIYILSTTARCLVMYMYT